MKKLLLLGLLIIGIIAHGQRFKVESFEKDESDLAARKNDRKDINGEACALIKIRSDVKGLGIDASMGVVGDIEFKRGAYWVYVSPGEQRLEIFKSGYVKLIYQIPLPVQSYDVFQMVLVSQGVGKSLPVTFMTTPDGTSIQVNTMKVSPNETREIEIGKHDVTVRKEGYKTLDTTITVDKKHVLFRFSLDEIEDAAVIINTEPENARVFLDGVEIGKTPISTFYKPGTYPLKISKEKYVPIEDQTITITTPQTKRRYTLKENVGSITVKTFPEATVLINGEEKPPNTKLKYSPKLLDVEIKIPKAGSFKKQIVLKRNEERIIEHYPDIPTGAIQIGVTPLDAKIRLTGEDGEVYTSEGMKKFKDIPIGTYNIRVFKEGYRKEQLSVQLEKGQKITKSIKLKEQKGGYSSRKTDTQNDWVRIKGGTLPQQYRASGEKNTFNEFYISKYEITVQQYIDFLNAVNCKGNGVYKGKRLFNPDMENFPLSYNNGQFEFSSNKMVKNSRYPIFGISWYGAKAYCVWADGRLPTTREWLFAALAGNSNHDYAGGDQLNSLAWHALNSDERIHEVGLKQANAFGLHDMTGNLWEWCAHNSNSQAVARTSSGKTNSKLYRYVKGGAFDCRNEESLKVTNILQVYPYACNRFIGFRMIKHK